MHLATSRLQSATLTDTLVSEMNPTQPDILDRPEDSSAPPPKRVLSAADIFLDSNGLRPIWGVVLFLLIWNLLRQFVFPLFQALFHTHSDTDLITPRRGYVFESASLLCVTIATILMARLERRTIASYGFRPQGGLRDFILGLVTGATLLSALVAVLHTSGLLIFDARLLFGGQILRSGLIWTVGFLLVAVAEEMLLRGYLQFTLTRTLDSLLSYLLPHRTPNRAGFWISACILSIAFGYGHIGNSGESPLGLVDAALVGLVFCLSLWRTGSLWWAIGFHLAWDWTQSFLYGVADSGLMVQGHLFATHPLGRSLLSGGLTGPEGSIFLFPVMLLACAVVFLTLPRTDSGYGTTDAPASASAALDSH